MLPKFCVSVLLIGELFYYSTAYVEGPEREENLPIPSSLKPLEYTLSFEVELADQKDFFMGTAIIKLKCVEPTSEIILNMKDIILDEDGVFVEIDSPGSETKRFGPLKPVVEKERLIINLEEQLQVNDIEEQLQVNDIIRIQIDYIKKYDLLEDTDYVFVKYNYRRKPDGEEKWLAVSKSGAINARKLYPCIDEVALKAKFYVQVVRNRNSISLSNSYINAEDVVESPVEEIVQVVAEPYRVTSDLSTFSIGIVVGDLKLKSVVDDERSWTEIRIWADEAVIEHMDFARDTTLTIFNFYREYFNSIHDAFKIDIAALPFYGQVDKWKYGLIILEESFISNPSPSNEVREIEIALMLCDVFCHQYFGPQTTLSTWSENWLNMGLALFFRIPCLENIFPEKETSIVNIHLVESFIRVLAVEAEMKSRPLMIPDSRIHLTNLFEDTMLAETAYFLVRMMSHFLGKAVFHEQVKNYIVDFKFKVTSLEQLWERFPLGKDNGKLPSDDITFKDIMNSWTSKSGFAHIKITRISGKKLVRIQQELPAASNGNDFPRIIPLNFVKNISDKKSKSSKKSNQDVKKSKSLRKSNREETVQYWLQSDPIEIYVEKNKWIVLDSRLDVLCRVEYDPEILELLRKTLMNKKKFETIPFMARTQLISDVFTSAEREKLSYKVVLKFMRYLKHETSVFPIIVALHEFNRIRLRLFGTDIISSFQEYVREILETIINKKKYTFSNFSEISENDYGEYYFKKLTVASACTFGVKSCIEQSVTLFENWLEDGDLIEKSDPISRIPHEDVFCQAIKKCDNEKWDLLFSFYSPKNWKNTNDIILSVLACTSSTEKLTQYLERSLDSKMIAPKDSLTVFKNVASNENGSALARSFFYDNVKTILEVNVNDVSKVFRYLEILYENIWNEEDLEQLNYFAKTSPTLQNDLGKINFRPYLSDSAQIARKNISWLKNLKTEMSEFFELKTWKKRIQKRFPI